MTGSVGLLSDAAESLVNLVAAVVALIALSVAARPADEEHAYGHTKAEYFSSGFEGALVLVAALLHRLDRRAAPAAPRPLEEVGRGWPSRWSPRSINLVVARVLFGAAGGATTRSRWRPTPTT